jgi:hypothetical protein
MTMRESRKISLDLSSLSYSSLTDLRTGETLTPSGTVVVRCEGLGYPLFTIKN